MKPRPPRETYHHQDGQRAAVELMAKVGKKAAGRLLDGTEHNGFPV